MKKLLSIFVAASMTLSFANLPCYSEEQTDYDYIDVLADNYVHNGGGNNNFGAAQKILTASANNTWSREIFFKFDLSDARSKDYIIQKAELSMQCVGDWRNNQPYEIYYVSDDSWTEGDKDKATSSVATDLTWNNSRKLAEDSIKIFDNEGGRPSLTLGELTYSDVTSAVLNEEDDMLSLRLIAKQTSGTNTLGIQIYSKEADIDNQYKPKIRLTVDKDPDRVAVYRDKAAIDLGNLINVTKDIILPKTGAVKGSTITWESSDSNVLEIIDGGDTYIAKYKIPDVAKDVVLTATIVSGAETDSRDFNVNVGNISSVELDFDSLSIDYDPAVKTIDLPAMGEYGSEISWVSSNETVITAEGQVKRPALKDADVKLTATISKSGLESKCKEFDLTVPALGYLLPVKDTRMHIDGKGANSGLSYGNDNVITTSEGPGRKAVVAFDLSELEGVVKKATVYMTKNDTNKNYIDINYVSNDNWEEGDGSAAVGNVICGNNYDELIVPEYKVGELYTGLKDVSFDATGVVQKELMGDKMLSLEIVKTNSYITTDLPAGKNTTSYPSSFFTKEYETADYSPENEKRIRLEVEYTTDEDEIELIGELAKLSLPNAVNADFELPTATESGIPVVWTSTDENYITSEGKVNLGEGDVSVKLTAAAEKNSKVITKDFFVVVKKSGNLFVIQNYLYKTTTGNLASSKPLDGTIHNVYISSYTNDSADLYFAVYNSEGSLVSVQRSDIEKGSLGKMLRCAINYDLSSADKTYSFKTMIMSDDGNLKPLAAAK